MMTSRIELLGRVEAWARDLLERDGAAAHGWPHVDRVRRLARAIAPPEGVEPWLAECAALLHDVGRAVPGPESEHGRRSAELAARPEGRGQDRQSARGAAEYASSHHLAARESHQLEAGQCRAA